MTRKLRFAVRLAEASAQSRSKEDDDRFPIGTAMAVIAGLNVALWSLIALAVKTLLF